MTDATLTVTQGTGTSIKTDQVAGVHTPYHKEDTDQRTALLAAFAGLATQTTLAALLAKVIAAPATEAKQDTLIGHVDGIETLITAANALLTTQAGYLDGLEGGQATIGTRTYGAAATRVTVGGTSAQSAAITATEVLVHASTRCFIAAGSNPTATTNDIPLESGEKFHMRITSGHKIAVLQDTSAGYLNIVPVA